MSLNKKESCFIDYEILSLMFVFNHIFGGFLIKKKFELYPHVTV